MREKDSKITSPVRARGRESLVTIRFRVREGGRERGGDSARTKLGPVRYDESGVFSSH